MFSINKALHSDFPKPAEDLQRIFMQYIHAVIVEKRDTNCKTISPQLENYFLTVKYSLLANKYTEAFLPLFSRYYCCLFLILLRDNETSCLSQIRKAKTCLAYQGQFWSSIKTKLGRLLRPTSATYYDQSQPSIMTKVFLHSLIFRTPYSE